MWFSTTNKSAASPSSASPMSNKYYKFNNSRSKLKPFFVYIEVGDGNIIDASGQKWAGIPKDSIEITRAEWLKVVKSGKGKIGVGDEVVILDYLPANKRYGIVAKLDAGNPKLSIGPGIILKDGRSFRLRSIRKSSFIHKA